MHFTHGPHMQACISGIEANTYTLNSHVHVHTFEHKRARHLDDMQVATFIIREEGIK